MLGKIEGKRYSSHVILKTFHLNDDQILASNAEVVVECIEF